MEKDAIEFSYSFFHIIIRIFVQFANEETSNFFKTYLELELGQKHVMRDAENQRDYQGVISGNDFVG